MPHRQRTPRSLPSDGDVRVATVRPMAGLLRELGHDPAAVFGARGLEATAFDDPERRVPFDLAADLVLRGSQLSGREDFGLLIGERFDFEDFGLLGQLMYRAPTVGEALRDLSRLQHVEDRASVTYLRPSQEGIATLGYSVFDPDTPGVGLVYDLVMAVGMRLLRSIAGPQFRAVEVWLPHAAPRRIRAYRRALGVSLQFDAPRAEIRFEDHWLQAPVAGADALQHERVQRAILAAEAGVPPGLASRTRAAVRALLMVGHVSTPCIAGALGLHERTLRRRLAAEGENLHRVVARARFEVACQLLRETRLGLRDIATALGYAEAAVFVRAFRAWAGCTPGQWREHGIEAVPGAASAPPRPRRPG